MSALAAIFFLKSPAYRFAHSFSVIRAEPCDGAKAAFRGGVQPALGFVVLR